ncbi:MAG TPA: Rv2993c-like domain-containing protein, partial [Gaiellaceae bacterium]|nr:Rv2993c-like domain-containing protein [Gaiellaceae bacterium]
MFHPVDHPLERGWVGRIEGDRVVQLAAQTLQSFFTGGGSAREHAEFPLAEVRLLAPVLHPPSIRVFDEQGGCAFANPAAIVGPGATVETARAPSDTVSQGRLGLLPRLAAVIGAEAEPAAFTILAEWRDPARRPPKDRDFALGLGPVAVTADALAPDGRTLAVRADGVERARGVF